LGAPLKKRTVKFDPVRAAVIDVLHLVFDKGWKSDEAITEVIAAHQFSDLDRRFLLQLSHGIVKMKRRLDFSYSFFLEKPGARIDKITRNILRLGLYQLIYTDRIPAGAAVSESVNLARGLVHESRGAFINAILRNFLRTPDKVVFPNKAENPVAYLADFYSYPDWFAEYTLNEFGLERAEQLLARGNEPPRLTYRLNRLRCNHEQLISILDQHQVKYRQGQYINDYYHILESGLPLEAELLTEGRVYIQDESAGYAVRLLNPKQRDKILDLCAAPGGKSTYAAAMMHNQGRITSVDVSMERLETLVDNCRRLGITILIPVVCDVLDFKGPACNRVLLDVPCSGWGVVGKHSDLRWMKDRSESHKLARLQAELIRHAAKLVTPGGVLVYSTCTIIRDENDSVVEEFLLQHPDFSIDKPGKTIHRELISERGFIKTYPNVEGLDGAFCVRLKKKLGANA